MTAKDSAVAPAATVGGMQTASIGGGEGASAREDRERALALAVAAAVREEIRLAVIDAWEDAGIQGLCAEGREEVAVGAIERLALTGIVERVLAAGRRN